MIRSAFWKEVSFWQRSDGWVGGVGKTEDRKIPKES